MAANAVTVAGVAISHPGKILWPATGDTKAVTKRDLAEHYARVAPRMLPHIAGRPLSTVRAPDGIEGQRFFQRHAMPGLPLAGEMRVRGEAKPFFTVRDRAGLVALAQAAVVEIHVWGAKKDDPETPGRIVFDLDPAPGVPFAAVIVAAKDLKTKLSVLGLVPFVKTTGGKGLHVMVPIRTTAKEAPSWRDAKGLALAVCRVLERDSPDRFTTHMSKDKRKGKIFLDYLRNDRMASAVAPWSARARPRAPIALPLAWGQLRASLDPQAFIIETTKTRLRRADPWKDVASSAMSLKAAVAKLRQS